MEIGKIILIGGGVGPLAGLHLHRLIIENTPDVKKDQDHLPVLHASLSSLIPDRTEAIFTGNPEDPGIRMAQIISSLADAAAKFGDRAMAGIPCNTFHVPATWRAFRAELYRLAPEVEVVHMIDQVIQVLRGRFSRGAAIGLLSTTGTRESGLYRSPLESAGFRILQVAPERQGEVHDAIYDPEWGIKATVPPSRRSVETFKGFAENLVQAGAEAIILGCTEIPLVLTEPDFHGIPLIDPMRELALGLING